MYAKSHKSAVPGSSTVYPSNIPPSRSIHPHTYIPTLLGNIIFRIPRQSPTRASYTIVQPWVVNGQGLEACMARVGNQAPCVRYNKI